VLTLVGNGAKTFEYYLFGPEYLFPSNSYSEDINTHRKIAEANTLISQSEDLLFEGVPDSNRVGLVLPLSATPWDFAGDKESRMDWFTEHGQEVTRLFLALKNANVPVEIIHEDDLSTVTGLARYKVIFLTEPNLPARAQKSLRIWVEKAGGTLATVAGAGSRDAYDLPSKFLSDTTFFGFQETITPSNKAVAVHLENDKTAIPYGISTLAAGTSDGLAGLGIKIVGRFSDKSPAVLQRAAGAGNLIHFLWLPGSSYYLNEQTPLTNDRNQLREDYSKSIQEWISYPLTVGHFFPSVTVDKPLVESHFLTSPRGDALVLINWTNRPYRRVGITLNQTKKKIICAKSAKQGVLTIREDVANHRAQFTAPLEVGDIVSLYYEPTSACR
jgi:hypothetical protein